MNIAPKARVAIIAALATVLLAGCSAAEPSTNDAATTAPSTPVVQTQPEARMVDVVKIVDPTTIVVTPVTKDDALYGTKFTVHLVDFSTAKKGQCGYAETLALTETTLIGRTWGLVYESTTDDVWIDAKGDHYGYLDSRGPSYNDTMTVNGFAYAKTGEQLSNPQEDAKQAGKGLWAACPDFGK